LKAEAKEPIALEILDAQKKVIRRYTSKPVKKEKPADEGEEEGEAIPPEELLPTSAGMHRFVWNLRYPLPEIAPTAIWDMGKPGAPMELPGTYEVRLQVAGKTYSAPLEVLQDPRTKTSRADLEAQLALWRETNDLLGRLHSTVLDMRAVRAQLRALHKRFSSGTDVAQKALASQIDGILKKMDPIEAELIEVKGKSSQDMCNYPTKLHNKIAWLMSSIGGADSAPTKQEQEFYAEKKREAETQITAWQKVLSDDVAALNDKIRSENVPAVLAGRQQKE
jgi:hypothetical protein